MKKQIKTRDRVKTDMALVPVVFCAVAMLASISCKKADDVSMKTDGVFVCATESHAGDGKTSLDGKNVLWSAGDKIRVWDNANNNYDFDLGEGVGTESGVFTNSAASLGDGPYVSVYPNLGEIASPASKDGDITIANVLLKQTQAYTEDGFGTNTNLMAAYSTDNSLQFANLCGLLKLTLRGACHVVSIALTGNGGEQLWGTGTVTVTPPTGEATEAIYKLDGLTNGGTTVFLECGYVDINDGKDFYFVLPNGVLSNGFSIEVDCDEGAFIKETNQDNSIEAGYIKTMPSVPVTPAQTHIGGMIGGGDSRKMFSVGSTTKVWFSQGNLQYNPAKHLWRFANCQWDYCDNITTSSNAK